MEPWQDIFSSFNATSNAQPIHHILLGSFRSLSLFLLAFSPLQRTLSLVQTIDAFGPHQYLSTNARKDRVYTTSWAFPPVLSSWAIESSESHPWKVNHINSVSITATSSYITIPPPYTHIYSAGGPTGEVHQVDQATGGFGDQIQQILFVPEDELESADKTRRSGSHGVEFSLPTNRAFIPVLGTNSIEMYTRDIHTGLLTHISSIPSPRDAHDGPRHVKIHPNGKILYCVTEHTNLVDAYHITPTSLSHISSRSLLPNTTPQSEISRFRGDTLLLVPSTQDEPTPRALFATTRGSTTATRGWLTVFALDADGLYSDDVEEERYEAPTSGGKAHAIDLLSKSVSFPKDDRNRNGVWIVLTDDDDHTASPEGGGGVRILEWDGWGVGGVKEVVGWPHPSTEGHESEAVTEERMAGGSHAVWLC
ncbi:putative isomerase YbhE [Tricholoma matsutake]|nr:putative isomerase YbhE [Tricholoma matsutake 945]